MILFSRLFLTSLVVVLSLPTFSAVASPQAEAIPERPKSEEILPETTVAWLQVPNFRETTDKLKETNAARMWSDESMTPLVEGFWEEAETAYDDVKEKVGLELSDLTSLPDGEITFAVIAPRRKNPEFLIMMELNEEDGVMDRVMERGRELLPKELPIADKVEIVGEEKIEGIIEAEPEVEEVAANEDGFEIEFFYADGKKIHFFRHKSTLVACTSLSELNDLIDRWMGREVEKTRPLSMNRRFVTIMKRCEGTNDLEPEFRFFVDPVAVAKSSTRGNAGARFTINLVLPLLGFDSLSGIGGTMFLDEEEYESVVHGHMLLTNPRAGIFALLAFKPTDYNPEEFIPQGVVNHAMISLDAPKAYAELTKIVDSFQEDGYFEKLVEGSVNDEIGIDLKADIIDSIDGRVTWFQWIEEPAMINSNRTGIVIRLKDSEKFKLLFDKLVEKANQDFGRRKKDDADAQKNVELRNYRDVTIYAEPRDRVNGRNDRISRRRNRNQNQEDEDEQREQMEIRIETPQFAIFDDCLVMSLDSDALMKAMIDAHDGEGDRLADDENYARIVDESRRLLDNELPIANFYSDPKRQLKWVMDIMGAESTKDVLGSAAEGNKYLSGFKRRLDENPLPDFDRLEKYINQSGGFMSDDDSGLHMLFFTLKSEEE